jgi:hypothetical protein
MKDWRAEDRWMKSKKKTKRETNTTYRNHNEGGTTPRSMVAVKVCSWPARGSVT